MCLLFSSNFYFSTKRWPFKNYKKCFLFHLKSSFCSWDIQLFVFLSFPFFLLVDHCFTGWLKINLKVHDAINYLNKNSITHFVWHLQKEKRHDTETLPVDGVSDKEHFYKKIMQKMCSKSWSQASLCWYIIQNSHCMQKIILKARYFETGLSKSLKKRNFISSFKPSPFIWTRLSKTKGAWN